MTDARVRLAVSGVLAGGTLLRAQSDDAIADGIARAVAAIADPSTGIGAEARAAIPGTSRLSPPMVDRCLVESCRAVTRESITRLQSRASSHESGMIRTSARLASVVLAGNVFSAALRAVLVPLALRVPVVCKAPTQDDVLARVLRAALSEHAPAIGAAFDVVTFTGGTEAFETPLFAESDVVSAHGSDQTIDAIRSRLPKGVRLIAHGHGLGACVVDMQGIDVEAAARAIAGDVAAYDQRGCLSPHFVLCVGDPKALVVALHRALAELATSLPRGALTMAEGTAQLQWRGVAVARGELLEGDGFSVALEPGVPRLSPGFRNVSVVPCADRDEVAARLATFGVHLKALGVASSAPLAQFVPLLAPPLAPRICAVGAMQTPPFDAATDGELPWSGLARYIELG